MRCRQRELTQRTGHYPVMAIVCQLRSNHEASIAYLYSPTHCDFIAIIFFLFFNRQHTTTSDFLYCHSRFAYTFPHVNDRAYYWISFSFRFRLVMHALCLSVYTFISAFGFFIQFTAVFFSSSINFSRDSSTRKKTKEMTRVCSWLCTLDLSI